MFMFLLLGIFGMFRILLWCVGGFGDPGFLVCLQHVLSGDVVKICVMRWQLWLVHNFFLYSLFVVRPITWPDKGSGTLMTSLYKENAQSWDTCISVLTFPILISSKKAFIGPIFMIKGKNVPGWFLSHFGSS